MRTSWKNFLNLRIDFFNSHWWSCQMKRCHVPRVIHKWKVIPWGLLVWKALKPTVFVDHTMKCIITENTHTFMAFSTHHRRWCLPAEQHFLSQDPWYVKIISEACWWVLVLFCDIDLIEYIWEVMERKLRAHRSPLCHPCDTCFYRLHSDIYRDLCIINTSMGCSFFQVRGGITKYEEGNECFHSFLLRHSTAYSIKKILWVAVRYFSVCGI